MAEKITEFYNGQINLADVAGGNKVTLLTTTAAQTAVITDLSLDYTGDVFGMDLVINEHKRGTFGGSAEGRELVGVSSAVDVKTDLVFRDIEIQVLNSAQDTIKLLGCEMLDNIPTAASAQSVAFSGSVTTGSYCTAIVDDSQSYLTCASWNGNDYTYIYKYDLSTGNAIQSYSYSDNSGQPVYGGDGYVYFMNSSSLLRLPIDDASAAQSVATGISGYGTNNYPPFGTNAKPAPNGDRLVIMAAGGGGYPVYATLLDSAGTTLFERQIGVTTDVFWKNSNNPGCEVHPFWSPRLEKWMVLFRAKGDSIRIAELPSVSTTAGPQKWVDGITLADADGLFAADDMILHVDVSAGKIVQYDLDLEEVGTLAMDTFLTDLYQKPRPAINITTPDQATIDSRDYSAAPTVNIRATGILVE